MSLRVWLPLNGTLDNQGLSSVTVTNNGATINDNGKIGKCYYFTPNQWIKISLPAEMTTIKNTTVAAWVKSHSTTMALGGISHDGAATLAGITLYSSGWQLSGGGNWKYINGGTIANTQVWHHVVCTIGDDEIITYLDGVKVTSSTLTAQTITNTTLTSTDNFIEIGCDHPGGDEYFTGYVNDFRIYDHALSAKEVKELAKGLVLHYKLDGKDETTTNLQSNGRMSTGSCYNGATQKYGFGTNTDIYYEDGNFQGRDCVKFKMGTAGSAAHPYTNIAYSPAINNYKTISFDYYPTILDKLVFYSYNGNSPCTWNYNVDGIKASSSTAATNIIVPVKTNKWNHVELTLYNTGTVADGWNYFQIGTGSHTSTTTDYWLFSNVQIEEKDHATPFTLGTRTYTTEYDCSGYNHNGAPIDTTLICKNDSTRYNNSLYFNGTTSGIIIDNLDIGNIINSAVTYSFWIKPDGENGARSIYFGSYSGNSWSIEKTAGNVLRSYWNGNPDTTISNLPITDGQWQHIVITKSGTADLKFYLNGVLKQSVTTTHNNISFPTTFRIGRDTRANDGTPYKGLMSDFRIYATALSADDVKELYQTAASIDNHGNVHAYEVME